MTAMKTRVLELIDSRLAEFAQIAHPSSEEQNSFDLLDGLRDEIAELPEED